MTRRTIRLAADPPVGFPGLLRRIACALLVLAMPVMISIKAVRAAELVMFETEGCVWCAAWNLEVGGIYHKTDEGRIAPLRRVELHGPRPEDLKDIESIVYTPTFVLTEDGQEVGRINGYPGNEHFWGLLGVLVKKLPPAPDLPPLRLMPERIVIDRTHDQLRESALNFKDRADSPDRWIAEGDSNQSGSALTEQEED